MTLLAMNCPYCRALLATPVPGCSSCQARLDVPVFFLQRGGANAGPYAFVQIMEMALHQQLLPTDLLMAQGQAVPVSVVDYGLVPRPAVSAFAGAASPSQNNTNSPNNPDRTAYQVGPAGKLPAFKLAKFHLSRAFQWNLRAVSVFDEERKLLADRGITQDEGTFFAVWRRSVLWVVSIPLAAFSTLALVQALFAEFKGLSALGIALSFVQVLSHFALPVAAILAARRWYELKTSKRIVLGGFLVAFLTPLIAALVPTDWLISLAEDSAIRALQQGLVQLAAGITTFVTLMPAVLSLIPGVMRACLRLKALLPQSMLPGYFLVATSPLYLMLFLITFIIINQMAASIVLILGVLALAGAPMVYLVKAKVFVQPLSSDAEITRLHRVTGIYSWISTCGVVLLLVFLFTGQIFGKSVVGFDDSAFLRPWDMKFLQFPLEYLSRSLFTTVVVADLFMMMNLSLWRSGKDFEKTEQAPAYDRLMTELELSEKEAKS